MIAVVSDLHLQQTDPDVVRYRAGQTVRQAGVRRNVRAAALTHFFRRVCANAERCGAKEVHVVFAGDVFELHRAPMWFLDANSDVRPFESRRTAMVRRRVLDLFDHLEAEHEAFWAELEAWVTSGLSKEGGDRLPVHVHYLPGNHDRLANLHPEVRRRVRSLLAMPDSDAPFPNRLDYTGGTLPDYGARIRHGHEYDAHNFAHPIARGAALDLNVEAYLEPAFGDYVTVEVATRLALAFRAYHGASMRRDDDVGRRLRRLYQDLTEFDDVRPPGLLFEYLAERVGGDDKEVFRTLKPLLVDVLEQARKSEFFLRRVPINSPLLPERTLLAALSTVVQAAPPVALRAGVRALASFGEEGHAGSTEGEGTPADSARWEPGLGSTVRFVFGGHTHRPEVVAVSRAEKRGGRPAFYLNTGTWRTTIPRGAGAFGRFRAYSMAFCYDDSEQLTYDDRRQFEIWTGHLAHRPPEGDPPPVDPDALALPYDEVAERLTPERYRLRVLSMEAKKVPDDAGDAEFRLFLGLDDAEDRSLRWDHVRVGATRTLTDAEGTFDLDPNLDGEVRIYGTERDPLVSDPLPWGLFRLPRIGKNRFEPGTPFKEGEGAFSLQGYGHTYVVVHFSVVKI